MLLLILAAAVAPLAVQAPASAQAGQRPPVQVPAEPALTQQIVRADAELFSLFFSGPCDVPRLRRMLAEGAEFYHDRKGFTSFDGFVAEYRADCERRVGREGGVRRELVAGSLTVTPITSYGAFLTGEHLFYVRSSAGDPERLVDRRRFAVLWRLADDGQWRLSRIVDFRSPPVR